MTKKVLTDEVTPDVNDGVELPVTEDVANLVPQNEGYFIQTESGEIVTKGKVSQKECMLIIKNELPEGCYQIGCLFGKVYRKEIVTYTRVV